MTLVTPQGIKTEHWNASSGGGVIFPRAIPKGCFPLAGAAATLRPRLEQHAIRRRQHLKQHAR